MNTAESTTNNDGVSNLKKQGISDSAITFVGNKKAGTKEQYCYL